MLIQGLVRLGKYFNRPAGLRLFFGWIKYLESKISKSTIFQPAAKSFMY